MNLTITGKNVEVTDALRNYVNLKLKRVLEFYSDVTTARVTLAVDNESEKSRRNHTAINFHQPGKESHISSEHADMYAAIDDLMKKLHVFLDRNKGKHSDHNHEMPKDLLLD